MKNKIIILVVAGVFVALIAALLFNNYQRNKGCSVDEPGGLSAAALLAQAKEFENKGDLLEEMIVYQQLVNQFVSSPDIAKWQKKLEDLNIKLLFSPTVTAQSELYEIKPGDTLVKIAKQFNTTVELIAKSNNLSSDRIIPGRKIKVWKTPFTIFVDKSQNVLLLKTAEDVFKTYTVSTGKDNCTPVGTFKIVNKLPNPTWFRSGAVVSPDSPDNVLGTRWMGFDLAGYGIHGTIEPQNLGKQVTEGCVRMSNPEVEELYTIVPVGTEVTIVN